MSFASIFPQIIIHPINNRNNIRICALSYIVFPILINILFTTNLSSTTLITGSGTLIGGGWRFSDTTSVQPDSSDILMVIASLSEDFLAGYPYIIGANTTLGASITVIPDTAFSALTSAPPDDSVEYPYTGWLWAYTNSTYVVKTQDNKYAKFHFVYLGPSHPIIEYAYQSDGSRNLNQEVGTTNVSWGKIKLIYK